MFIIPDQEMIITINNGNFAGAVNMSIFRLLRTISFQASCNSTCSILPSTKNRRTFGQMCAEKADLSKVTVLEM